jgi:hypothetical protein
MRELDDKIAMLLGVGAPLENRPGEIGPPTWSTSLDKAFELIDDIHSRDGSAASHFRASESRIEVRIILSKAFGGREFHGMGTSRAEAICGAYIAAREWLDTLEDKGGAGGKKPEKKPGHPGGD